MKTTITLSAILIFGICTGFSPVTTIHSKPSASVEKGSAASCFEFFRTHRQGRAAITATWGISAPGNDVRGFLVERTYEDPADPYANWEIVSAMPNTGGRSFKCTDNNVFPGFVS